MRTIAREKVWKFVEAYTGLAQGNQAEAARIAGYKGGNKQLSEAGRRLLARADVQEAIGKKRSTSPLVLTKDEVLEMLTQQAKGEGRFKKWPPGEQQRALIALAKALGMFVHGNKEPPKQEIVIILPDNGRDGGEIVDMTPTETSG